MSLNLNKLEKVREVGNGMTQARCPACAEGGSDRKGEHLWIYPDGRFGCCVFPKDKGHRGRIFALAGDKTPRPMRLRLADGTPAATPARSISESLRGFLGTLGTGDFNPRGYGRKEIMHTHDVAHMCNGSERSVPSVPSGERPKPLPYLTPDGTLVIPFDSPKHYHWWNHGQTVALTIAELQGQAPAGAANGLSKGD